MYFKQLIKKSITGITLLFLWGCGSSAEYTTAKMAIGDEEWEKAEEYLFKALKVDSTDAQIMFDIGLHVYAKKQQWVAMNEMFDNALKANPEAKINSNPILDEINRRRQIFWIENYKKAGVNYDEFRSTNDKTKLQAAITGFEQAAQIDPLQGQTYSILSTSYYEFGNNDKAIQNGKKATELMPGDFETHYVLGQIFSLSGDNKSAIDYILKAIEIDPSSSIAVTTLAGLYYSTGDKEKSLETFEAAIKTETDKVKKADLYYNLGVLNAEMGDYGASEEAFDSAFYYNPDDKQALAGMALSYENSEKWRQALNYYKELIALDAEDPEGYKGAVRMLMKLERPDDADRYFKKLNKLLSN